MFTISKRCKTKGQSNNHAILNQIYKLQIYISKRPPSRANWTKAQLYSKRNFWTPDSILIHSNTFNNQYFTAAHEM